jgi:tetratricopeptide (TPR) repeat protein
MEGINSIFDRLEAQGIDTKQEFLYGYFFCGKNDVPLENLKQVLGQQLYSFVEIRKDEDLFVLHVEKIESHTRESLFAAKQNFTKLAERDGIFYDGFDIGNSDPAKPLISDKNFQKFMTTHQDDDLFQWGIKLYDLEIYDKAITVFLECLKKNIKPDVVSYKLGNVLSWQGDIEDGLKYLEQAVKLNPDYLDAWFNLGAICYANNLFEESIKYYRQADKLNPHNEDIVYGIAAAQFARAQFDESLENCQKVLALNPRHENANALLKMIKDNKRT